jgi:hypothetical protein
LEVTEKNGSSTSLKATPDGTFRLPTRAGGIYQIKG